jgi:hypothetical protein
MRPGTIARARASTNRMDWNGETLGRDAETGQDPLESERISSHNRQQIEDHIEDTGEYGE